MGHDRAWPPFDFPLLLVNRRRIWTLYRTFYLLLPRSPCHLFFFFLRGVLSYLHRKLNPILWLLSRPVILLSRLPSLVCGPWTVALAYEDVILLSGALTCKERHIQICTSVIENQVQEIFPSNLTSAACTTQRDRRSSVSTGGRMSFFCAPPALAIDVRYLCDTTISAPEVSRQAACA